VDAVNIADTERRLSLGDLDRSASFLLRIAQLASYEAIFALDPDMPLSLSEQTLLIAIDENPDARQGTVADLLHIKWSNMTKLVRGLEERGLLERVVPPDDRRSVLLRPTDEGKRMLEAVRLRQRARDENVLAMLSSAERQQLVGLLRKVAGWPALPEHAQ